MKTLSTLLDRIIVQNGWEDDVTASKIFEMWEEIFGDTAGKVIKLKSYKNKVITLKIDNPTWKVEIMLRKPQLIARINDLLENNYVEEIVIH